jgi:hypothetical protein
VSVVIEYLASDAQCDAWHGGVGATHGIDPGKVKRWPNILGNGGTYKTCLEGAGLALDGPRDTRVERMEKELHALRRSIMQVSREKPDALWPRSEHFVNRHDARLRRDKPDLEQPKRFNRVFAYLIQTAEDKILEIHATAQRLARRNAVGAAAFDAMAPSRRDTGGYAFDGLMTERAVDDPDPQKGDREAEAALIAEGWEAQEWGITYKIVEKPMYGKDEDPDKFVSAIEARRALSEAVSAYSEVDRAVKRATEQAMSS